MGPWNVDNERDGSEKNINGHRDTNSRLFKIKTWASIKIK